MRKLTYAGWLCLSITAILLVSCQKESSLLQQDITISNNDNKAVTEKVNTWLDNSKSVDQPNKAANIELLKNNLDFSAMRVEKFGLGEQLITIPVKEAFKTSKKVDKNVTPYLLLVVGNTGKIQKGNLVLYTPKEVQVNNKIPDDAFRKIFNNDDPDCSGKFLFLSVTGRKLFQLEYNDGKLQSYSISTTDTKGQNAGPSILPTSSNCIDWYWVTTYYDENGSIISQTWEYITTTCEGCDHPDLEMLCPDNGGGGGGGGSWDDYAAVIAQASWTVDAAGEWAVVSTESFTGMRNPSTPASGYFTGMTHNGSLMVAAGNLFMTWTQTGATTNYGGNQASILISGVIRHDDQDPNLRYVIYVNGKHKPFFFSMLNWY